MKRAIIALASLFVVATIQSASASTASQREYKRGYNDCMAGRYDQNQHGSSYKKGCRAAEDKLAKKKKPAVEECPVDVSEADRYKYPACN